MISRDVFLYYVARPMFILVYAYFLFQLESTNEVVHGPPKPSYATAERSPTVIFDATSTKTTLRTAKNALCSTSRSDLTFWKI